MNKEIDCADDPLEEKSTLRLMALGYPNLSRKCPNTTMWNRCSSFLAHKGQKGSLVLLSGLNYEVLFHNGLPAVVEFWEVKIRVACATKGRTDPQYCKFGTSEEDTLTHLEFCVLLDEVEIAKGVVIKRR
jgi:hypothetical protein